MHDPSLTDWDILAVIQEIVDNDIRSYLAEVACFSCKLEPGCHENWCMRERLIIVYMQPRKICVFGNGLKKIRINLCILQGFFHIE